MKVFLDTNVLVSAVGTRGLAADLLRLVLDKHELVTSESVLEETERVLTRKFGMTADQVASVLRFLRRFPVQPKPPHPAQLELNDEDDLWILQEAIDSKADLLVTGDAAFRSAAAQVPRPHIVTPREFWEMNRGSRS